MIISLDGPQGWREPDAPPRKGVGRLCEYEAKTQGKTGEYGKTYPTTQKGWIEFSISVFDALLALPEVELANKPSRLAPRKAGYWVIECFPTESWRSLGIQPLPAKSTAKSDTVAAWARELWSKLSLPPVLGPMTHDDLQAIVAATAGAAAMGGPLRMRTQGKPAWESQASTSAPAHRVEGLIWSASANDSSGAKQALHLPVNRAARIPLFATGEETKEVDATNTLLPDERSDVGDEALARGVALFQELVACANAGQAIGIDYAYFVAFVHGGRSFKEVVGRNFAASDIRNSVGLAFAVTEAAGGPKKVRRGETEIDAGMDSFVWSQSANRSLKAWNDPLTAPPYTPEAWRLVFPDELRVVRTRNAPNPITPREECGA